jgi:hypothetical protein
VFGCCGDEALSEPLSEPLSDSLVFGVSHAVKIPSKQADNKQVNKMSHFFFIIFLLFLAFGKLRFYNLPKIYFTNF